MDPLTQAGLILGVTLTVAAFSQILFKDNPLFRFAEATFVGVGLANTLVLNVVAIRDKGLLPALGGKWWYIIVLLLGFLVLSRVSSRIGWLSRYPIAIIVGTGTGLALYGRAETEIVKMIEATTISVIGGKYTPIDYLIIAVSTMTVLTYFLFTIKPSKYYASVSRIGRAFLLLAFGGFFGNTVMSRLVWLGDRFGYIVTSIKTLLGI